MNVYVKCPPTPSIHPASAGGANLNRGKKKGAHLPNPSRVNVKKGALRSNVTVIRVDPAMLKRSRAATRTGNVSDAMLNRGEIVARNVKSRAGLRKLTNS